MVYSEIHVYIYIYIYIYGHVYLVPVKVFWLDGKPREVFTIRPPPYNPMPPQQKTKPWLIFDVGFFDFEKMTFLEKIDMYLIVLVMFC